MSSSAKLESASATIRRLEEQGTEMAEVLRTMNQPQSAESNRLALDDFVYHQHQGLAALLALLASDATSGIRTETIATRRAIFGENVVPQAPRKSFMELSTRW